MSNGFDDWVEGKSGWEWLFGPVYPSMEARAFYQPWVVEAFLAQEKHDRMKRQVVASGQLIDDVAGQLTN